MKRVMLLAALVSVCSFAFVGSADAGVGLRGVGGGLVIVAPDNMDATLGVGFLMDMGITGTQFGLEGYSNYWSQSESFFGVESSISDFVIGGRAKYEFLPTPSLRPYLGAGTGLHFLTAKVDIPSFGGLFVGSSVEDTTTKLGLDLGGGMTYDLGERAALLADSWIVLVEDASQFTMRFGMLYRL